MRVLKISGVPLTDTLREIAAKNRKMAIPVISGVLLFLALFFVMLAPTRRELTDKRRKWRELEVQLKADRAKLANFRIDKATVEAKVEDLRRRIPPKSPTSAILEELTKRGKQLNIDFVSITPQQLQKDTTVAPDCEVLPIIINMRATYKGLGEYLGQIENLQSSFATVNEFQVTKDERTYPKLVVNMRINTYILKKDESGQR